MSLPRHVREELLDTLAPDDPRAIRSRGDLRRINRLMASQSLMQGPLDKILRGLTSVRLVEIGAGDGEMMLPIARRHSHDWPKASLELLDMQPVVNARTLQSYQAVGWDAKVIRTDVFDWLARPVSGTAPVIIANLFVHHFEGERLRDLLEGIAKRAKAFVCCEPRRSRLALGFSRSLGMIGCNTVTRHDAVASVHAGFRARELSALWPRTGGWRLQEGPAGLFSHRFQAIAEHV